MCASQHIAEVVASPSPTFRSDFFFSTSPRQAGDIHREEDCSTLTVADFHRFNVGFSRVLLISSMTRLLVEGRKFEWIYQYWIPRRRDLSVTLRAEGRETTRKNLGKNCDRAVVWTIEIRLCKKIKYRIDYTVRNRKWTMANSEFITA